MNGSQIDHMFVAKRMLEDTIDEDTFKVHSVTDGELEAYRKRFSDHFSVTVGIRSHDDED